MKNEQQSNKEVYKTTNVYNSTTSLSPRQTPQDTVISDEDAKYYNVKKIKFEKLIIKLS